MSINEKYFKNTYINEKINSECSVSDSQNYQIIFSKIQTVSKLKTRLIVFLTMKK